MENRYYVNTLVKVWVMENWWDKTDEKYPNLKIEDCPEEFGRSIYDLVENRKVDQAEFEAKYKKVLIPKYEFTGYDTSNTKLEEKFSRQQLENLVKYVTKLKKFEKFLKAEKADFAEDLADIKELQSVFCQICRFLLILKPKFSKFVENYLEFEDRVYKLKLGNDILNSFIE